MIQEITSAATSQNQCPALHRTVKVQGLTVFDYGCGKYTKGRDALLSRGAYDVIRFDPFHFSKEWNDHSIDYCELAEVVLCANVLNVLHSPELLDGVVLVLHNIAALSGADVHVSVYEGDRSGVGKETSRGYQRNAKAKDYEAVLSAHFNTVTRNGNTFTCSLKDL